MYTRYHQYIDIDSIPSIECQSSHPGKSDNISSEDYIWLQCMASQVMSINLYQDKRSIIAWKCCRCDSMNCDRFTLGSYDIQISNSFHPLTFLDSTIDDSM